MGTIIAIPRHRINFPYMAVSNFIEHSGASPDSSGPTKYSLDALAITAALERELLAFRL